MTALHDGWTLRPLEGPVPPGLADRAVPATVPGCVHTDLLAAGLIPDPYLDENERLLELDRAHRLALHDDLRGPPRPRRASASTWSSTVSTPSPR